MVFTKPFSEISKNDASVAGKRTSLGALEAVAVASKERFVK